MCMKFAAYMVLFLSHFVMFLVPFFIIVSMVVCLYMFV